MSAGGLAAGWSADLAAAVYARLEVLDEVAAGLRRRSGAELEQIREEMAGQLVAWRRLLQLHQADEHGRCPRCRGWVLRRRWPCRVWTTAHRSLITSGAVECAASGRVLVPYPRATGTPDPGRVALSAPNCSGPGRGLLIRARVGGAR